MGSLTFVESVNVVSSRISSVLLLSGQVVIGAEVTNGDDCSSRQEIIMAMSTRTNSGE